MTHRARSFAPVHFVWMLPVLLALLTPQGANAQVQKVQFTLPSFDWDVIYLSDFLDVKTQRLATSIPNFTGDIMAFNANGGTATGLIYLKAETYLRLKGDAAPSLLARAVTNPFQINGRRTLSARDLQKGGSGSDIVVKDSYYDPTQKKRLEDYVANFPTAPVGVYRLDLYAYDVTDRELGRTSREIDVRNSSPEEVIVTLIDPQPGALVQTVLPTFSWSSPNPKVTLYVYEKLPIQHSPQEAVSGIPHLQKDLAGGSTYTYTSNEGRHLEQGHSYVWFVETQVTTNRGLVKRRSDFNVFRIFATDARLQAIERFLNSLGSNVSGTYSTLQGIGWVPRGDILVDGRRVNMEELTGVGNSLTGKNIQPSVRVE